MTGLAGLDDLPRATLLDNIASIIFGIADGSVFSNASRYRMATMKAASQRIRLICSSLTQGDLCYIQHDDSMQSTIDAGNLKCGFDSAWAEQGLSGRFEQLDRFVGGLTSPYPNTAPVQSDSSILKFHKMRVTITDQLFS